MDLEARMDHSERRMDRVEKKLEATGKIIYAGMKMLTKMQEETRQFRGETRRAINALIEAQMRTDAKLNRLVAGLERPGGNGHGRR